MTLMPGAHFHRAAHGLLHGAAEGNALFELTGDVLGDQLCVGIGRTHLDDGEGHGLADHLFHHLAQALDLRTALANHDTRP
jgi:hypothetical protein